MANQSIEFHDSTLAVMWYEQSGEAVLVFKWLYIHESEGEPGVDAGVGWFQRAVLTLENASDAEFIRAWPCEIYDGEAVVDGVRHGNGFPLPLRCERSIRIVLEALDDEGSRRRIELEGDGAALTLLDKRWGFEDFPADGTRD
jgi:hypothetical protein